ncbi:MAG: DUF1648 domain-containing protein [Isosphaeraceae bacterium]
MSNRTCWIVGFALVAIAWIATAAIYPNLPERLPTHWNARGEVDGYGDRAWAAFAMPAGMAAMLGLFAALPWLSPKRFSVADFRNTSLQIMLVVLGLFAYMQILTLYTGLKGGVDAARALVGGMMLFFAALGNLMGKVRRNFYIGVRTPWTIASERVWNDTHRLAAWTWVAGGLAGSALAWAGYLIGATVMLAPLVLVPVVYSFVHYKALEKRGQLDAEAAG